MGDLSAHFSRREFACHHCGVVKVATGVVDALERLRAAVGRPLTVVSGYRCVAHNRAIGGARRSRHLVGAAVDVKAGYCTPAQAHAAGFVGVGVNRHGQVVHVDLRPGPAITFNDF